MSLGHRIALFRKQKGWRQKELAAKLDVHPRHVTRWETDRVRPRNDTLEKLAELMDVPLDELLAEAPQLPPEGALEDADLRALLGQVHRLSTKEQEALKTFLQAMLTRARVEEALQC